MELAELLAQVEQSLASLFLVFLRVGSATAVLPLFGERSVPPQVRLAVGFCLAVLTLILLPKRPILPSEFSEIALALISEPLIGIVFGLGIRFFMFALQTAGTIAAQATSLSQLFGGTTAEPMPAIGSLLMLGGLALLAILDVHLMVVLAAVETYELIPVGALFAPNDLLAWGVSEVSRSFYLAFSLAAPFTLVSLVYNLALGVINKAMPQLMVALVGAPAITGGALILLFWSTPLLLSLWAEAVTTYLNQPFGDRSG